MVLIPDMHFSKVQMFKSYNGKGMNFEVTSWVAGKCPISAQPEVLSTIAKLTKPLWGPNALLLIENSITLLPSTVLNAEN